MLQPLELQRVSQRFPSEIAQLRRFFEQAAIPVDNRSATRAIAIRLTENQAFHRDLASHVWILLDESGPGLRSADLLGIVMIAAVGVSAAPLADEEAALAILGFLIRTKHAFESSTAETAIAPSEKAALSSAIQARRDVDATVSAGPAVDAPFAGPQRSMPRAVASTVEPVAVLHESLKRSETHRPSRTWLFWGVAAVVIVALLAWIIPRRNHANTPESAGGSDALSSSAVVGSNSNKSSMTPRSAEPAIGKRETSGELSRSSPHQFDSYTPRVTGRGESYTSSGATDAGQPVIVSRSPSVSAPAPTTAAITDGDAANRSSIIAGLTKPNATKPYAVPADTLSQRLDSPRLPAYAAMDEEGSRGKYPHLFRRHNDPGAYSQSDSNQTLTAVLEAPDLSKAAGPSRNSASSVTIHGLVRSTCVGMMAGNLIYSPAPRYPEGAASARVQGEVKIQATIDRDGSINSARVISGPPLLRDAALDAVQHWRYKPFTSGGKPTPTGTLAIVEFELQ